MLNTIGDAGVKTDAVVHAGCAGWATAAAFVFEIAVAPKAIQAERAVTKWALAKPKHAAVTDCGKFAGCANPGA